MLGALRTSLMERFASIRSFIYEPHLPWLGFLCTYLSIYLCLQVYQHPRVRTRDETADESVQRLQLFLVHHWHLPEARVWFES